MFRSIVEAVFAHAKATPDKLCLADDTARVTYREYAEKIEKAATEKDNAGKPSNEEEQANDSQRTDESVCRYVL